MTTDETTTATPKPRRRWRQFSLRTLMALVVVVSVGMSWFAVKMREARRQREAVEAIRKLGGEVEYDFQVTEDGTIPISYAQSPYPDWLRDLLGDDFFSDVRSVSIVGPTKGLTNDSDAAIDAMTHVKVLTRLRALTLCKLQITDADLTHLRGLTQLNYLCLLGTRITDNGLAELRPLTELTDLHIPQNCISDAGLESLEHFPRLRWLDLDYTQVTAEGERQLQKVLPDCYISRHPWR